MANIFDFGFKEYKIKMDGSYFMGGYFAVMGDTARRVEVRLLGTDNVVRDASGLRLQLWADAGGKVSYVEGEAVEPEKGRYRFDLINGLLLSPGVQKFQWRIIDSDGRKINSIQFNGRIGNDLEGDAWEDVHQLYLNTGQLKKEVDEVRKLQKDLIDGAVDSAAVQQHVEERYGELEAEYAESLSALKRSDEETTAQLAQKVTKNRGEITSSDLSQEVKEQMTGGSVAVVGRNAVLSENIVPDQVTTYHVDFLNKNIKDLSQSLEHFPNRALVGSGLRYDQVNEGFSYGLRVETYRTYIITPQSNHTGWDRTRIALFESKPQLKYLPIKQIINDDEYKEGITFSTGGKGGYVVIYLSSLGEEVPVEVTAYEDRAEINKKFVSLQEESVTEGMTTFINLSKKNIAKNGSYRSGFLGKHGVINAYQAPNESAPNAECLFVNIEPNQTYTITPHESAIRNRYALATGLILPTETGADNPNLNIFYHEDGNNEAVTFTSGSSDRYLILQLHNNGKRIPVQIEKGTESTAYEQPAWLDEDILPWEDIRTFIENISDNSSDGLIDNYNRKHDLLYQTEPISITGSELNDSDINYIYSKYDGLMDKFPDLITKRLLGYGYNQNEEVSESHPVYEYTISNTQTVQLEQSGVGTLLTESPTILMTSGVHGDEKTAVLGLFETVKQMMENSQNNEVVNRLKSRYSFRIIPIVNPGGYNANTRNNLRNVNINRNFTYNNDDSALSEIETQIVYNWMDENKEAFAYIDFHNFGRRADREEPPVSYHVSDNVELDQMYSSMIRELSPRWSKIYLEDFADKGNVAYGFLLSDVYEGTSMTCSEAYHTFGIELSSTPESTYEDPNRVGVRNTSTTVELSVEIFMNYLLHLDRKFGS